MELEKLIVEFAAATEDFFALVEKFVNTLATWTSLANATQEASSVDASVSDMLRV